MGAIKDVGQYSVNNRRVLLSWCGDIPVDSEVIKHLRQTHFDGREMSPREAVKPYECYGKYQFLSYKFGRMARRMNHVDK